MEKKFKTRVRLMEMARRNRANRAFIISRENPQMRLSRLNSWNFPKEDESEKINQTPQGQLVIWETNKLSNK